MRFNKNIFLSTVIALASLPIIANATTLVTQNHSAKPSTVKVNSVCVGLLPAPFKVITPAGGVSTVTDDSVNKLCGGKQRHKCVADIHMTENCSDAAVAKAYFDLDKFSIENIAMTAGVPYAITWSGTVVTINPA